MGKNYLLWKIKIFCVRFVDLFGCFLVAIEFILDEVNNIYIFFMGIELTSINSKEEISHSIIIDKCIQAVAGKIKKFG